MNTSKCGMRNAECGMPSECGVRNAESGMSDAGRNPQSAIRNPQSRGFTMVEIAISLAVIGFALVAIIGILPRGMNIQKKNREDTIINHDASVFFDAIRNGAQGLDDLTNYVVAITNSVTQYDVRRGQTGPPWRNWYTYNGSSTSPPLLLTNGFRIIGLLSTPKYIPIYQPGRTGPVNVGFYSNHVVAYVHSISGSASDQVPTSYAANQNPVQELAFTLAFSYRMISDVVPYMGYDTNTAWFGQPGISTNEMVGRSNYWMYAQNVQTNLHDVRLSFLWPMLSAIPPGRQMFRGMASGSLSFTNEPGYGSPPVPWSTTLFFFQPRTYLQVSTP